MADLKRWAKDTVVTVYRLAHDKEKIASIQKATLTTSDFGIRQTHGLFGSKEWWVKIAAGELPQHTLKGVISKVYMGSMGDWPEFRVKTEDGAEESFTREYSTRELAAEYREGRAVEIDYVWQQHKKSWTGALETKITLEIRLQ